MQHVLALLLTTAVLADAVIPPTEVNTSCHYDGSVDSYSNEVCESVLECPAGYALSAAHPSCLEGCSVYGAAYVTSRAIKQSPQCFDLLASWYGTLFECRTCVPHGGPATTITITTTPQTPFFPAGQACRGDNATDDSPEYYVLTHADDVLQCKEKCLEAPVCDGLEFGNGRCEIWTRVIGASADVAGFECFRAMYATHTFTILP